MMTRCSPAHFLGWVIRSGTTHVVLQSTDTLLSAPLRLGEFFDTLLGAPLRLGEFFDTLLGTLLRLGQVAHYLGERQQLLGQHESAQLCPPLGVLLENPDEIVKILYHESHNASALVQGIVSKLSKAMRAYSIGAHPGKPGQRGRRCSTVDRLSLTGGYRSESVTCILTLY
jgi:hypothetical protein